MSEAICPFCHFPVSSDFFFCPNCGKEIKQAPVSISLLKQLSLFALSLFLPPLGLWPGIKYLSQNDPQAKKIGLIAIVLTLISTIITIWLAINFFGKINNTIINQLDPYQNLGL